MSNNDVVTMCKGIEQALQGVLTWKWDSRFETVLAEFSVGRREEVCQALEEYLTFLWNRELIHEAPVNIQMLSNHLGGLMPGQMLFASDPEEDEFVFCAWWPWGDGETVSIRLAPIHSNITDAQRAEKDAQLREIFGV